MRVSSNYSQTDKHQLKILIIAQIKTPKIIQAINAAKKPFHPFSIIASQNGLKNVPIKNRSNNTNNNPEIIFFIIVNIITTANNGYTIVGLIV